MASNSNSSKTKSARSSSNSKSDSNVNKNNCDSNANVDEEKAHENTCVITNTLKSLEADWLELYPNEPLEMEDLMWLMTGLRTGRIHRYIASPLCQIGQHATMCANLLNVLRRFDVNHHLILAFVSVAVDGAPKDVIVENTIRKAAIHWAEMVIVTYYHHNT